jgi:Fe/S biogenesis protein NfuA
MTDSPTTIRRRVLRMTPEALVRLTELSASRPNDGRVVFRLRVAAIDDQHYHHDLRFADPADLVATDVIESHGGVDVVIALADVAKLRGATLDLDASEGLIVRNPNAPDSAAARGLIDDDQLACEIRDVLAFEVNPGLAEHGGYVELVGHDGAGSANIRMGGGCHGCALSPVTMREGVHAVLTQRVPGIVNVVDVTEHSTGAHPHFH